MEDHVLAILANVIRAHAVVPWPLSKKISLRYTEDHVLAILANVIRAHASGETCQSLELPRAYGFMRNIWPE